MTNHRSIVREAIVAVTGEDDLNPPIQNPAESLWDARIGSEDADVFKGFNGRPRKVSDSPAKLLSAQGINTLRDAAIVGAGLLASAPDLGPGAVIHMWRGMRSLEPSLPLPFNPNLSTIARLSFGDIGRVPLVAATQKWFPDVTVAMFDGRPTVEKAMKFIEENRTPYVIEDIAGQARFEDDVLEFASLYNQTTLSQGEA
jgi:hypothetical protein